MHPDDITAEIQKRRLAKLGGKTPNASVAARLAVHHAQGLYFDRPDRRSQDVIALPSDEAETPWLLQNATGCDSRRRLIKQPNSTSKRQESPANAGLLSF